jgi:signal transduction histidine kinase/ActR/RegA family two-component response regulator/HPt (histidine-containing phosphotransfer) domain-containing protein
VNTAGVAASHQPRVSWLGLVGFGLVLALLAVALVQARQFSLLRQAVQTGDDFGMLTIFQAETEYLRLREQWAEAIDDRRPLDLDALRLRYEIWVSRVELLHADKTARLIASDDEYRATLTQADAFIIGADRALGKRPETEPNRLFLQAQWPALQALGKPMHGMSLGAAHHVAQQMEQRAVAVRNQNQLGLFLTVFLSVLTLAFAAIALRQVRQLRERRVVLEDLAASLRQARRDAEAASEAKSAFLANMSHEIRTPFHGLMGMLSLLRETGLNAKQIDYLRTATESADHLLAILNDILDMSQLESGRMTLAPAPVELRSLLRDVEALMRPQANAKHLALHIDADPGVPERVLLDATRVKQVVFNLLSNAIKFSERGAVVLDVRCHQPGPGDAQGAAELQFVVTDTGIGMDEAMLSQLFNRFMPGDSSRSRRHAGAGLGLEISRNLARLMGGDITVRSKPGEGSAFSFRAPVQVLQPAAPPRSESPQPGAGPSRRLHVLVAEDHPVNRQYLAALLDNLGHQAHFSTNGQEAVQALQQHRERRFDLVLMDLHMPVLDGVGATRAIRALADPALSTVPIVALTADAFPETRDRCLVAGMNDFLTKPVSPQKLATSLRRLFGVGVGSVPAPPEAPAASVLPAGTTPLVDEAAIAMSLQVMPAHQLAAMIDGFLEQGPDTVNRLRAAVRDAQPLELRVNAHAVKGAALNLGLSGLAATAQALQEGAAHLPAHEIARLVQRYEEQLPLTRQAVQALGLAGAAPAAALTR